MKHSLCQLIAIVCVFAMGFMTLTPFVPNVEALPDRIISTEIAETCYLIGYPRTNCGTRHYTVTTPEYDHPVGDETHSVAMINRRERRTKNVYGSCSQCDS